jgi:GntR family transcriptional repressor for pyruvate dehydrogenase complex
VRTRILTDGLAPGDVLPSEGELMEEHGLSRATVREGLRLLEAEGLITVKRGPHGGVFVSYPDIQHVSHSLALMLALSEAPLRDLFQFRAMIEPAAAALAADAATPEQRSILLDATSSAEHLSAREHVALHVQVAEATNNDLLRLVLNALQEVVGSHSARERLSEEDLRETAHAHRKIAEAIAKGQPNAAERAMRHHLARYEERMTEQGRIDEPIVPREDWRRSQV